MSQSLRTDYAYPMTLPAPLAEREATLYNLFMLPIFAGTCLLAS